MQLTEKRIQSFEAVPGEASPYLLHGAQGQGIELKIYSEQAMLKLTP